MDDIELNEKIIKDCMGQNLYNGLKQKLNGNTPFNYDNWINVVYVISERNMNGHNNYIVQEYPVSIQDYYKIKVGQRVTLEVPDSRTKVCKVVKIE